MICAFLCVCCRLRVPGAVERPLVSIGESGVGDGERVHDDQQGPLHRDQRRQVSHSGHVSLSPSLSLSRLNCKWDIYIYIYSLSWLYARANVCVCASIRSHIVTRVYYIAYRQAAVDMKRCTDRISLSSFIHHHRRHPWPTPVPSFY